MSHMSMFFDSVNNGLTISIDSSSIVMMGKKIGHHNQRNYLLIETHQDLETRNIPTQHSSSRGPSYSSSALYFWAVTGEGKWMTIICNMASPAGSHFLITVCRSQVNKQKLTSQSAGLLTLSNNLNIILCIYLKMYYISSKICVLMTQYAKSTHTHLQQGFPFQLFILKGQFHAKLLYKCYSFLLGLCHAVTEDLRRKILHSF